MDELKHPKIQDQGWYWVSKCKRCGDRQVSYHCGLLSETNCNSCNSRAFGLRDITTEWLPDRDPKGG